MCMYVEGLCSFELNRFRVAGDRETFALLPLLFLYRPTVHGLGFLRIAKLANNPARFANGLIICIYFAAIFVKPSIVKVVAYHIHIFYSLKTKEKEIGLLQEIMQLRIMSLKAVH